ncbi:LacI family DNA-binding transcriptional regulator [Clostridium brassicae]|uniref:LacI family DNA-binding transcriptional regulator n=1 Tax=Clostridium brassicae TaxID=2999072 RepID=A0ABT4D4U4_9CLOT|nr:LacI family DNA-binding transcriptional regulator [Clostridium brassicae]MCY6957302.1 LacI family DNA-binding transcriptional regulator [Clostridium brassicae]
MSTTIKDIARKLNISIATVSKALNDSYDISDKTKKRVREAAKEMNYKPNAIAQGLVTNKTNTIGLIIPDITNPFYPEIARGVEEELNKYGYNIFLCNSNWEIKKEEKYIDLLVSKQVEGIILAHSGVKNGSLENIDIPIVSVATKSGYKGENFVVIDDKKGGYLATKHLLDSGYKSIMFIGGQNTIETNRMRFEGYKQALMEQGIQLDERLIKNGDFTKESGYVLVKNSLKEGIIPTGIFGGTDMLALGVMQAVRECGLNIPEDIGIVGFDDISFSQLPEISLTTIAQPKYDMGVISAKTLLDKINKSKGKDTILNPKLIIRKTTRKVYD